MIPIPPSLTSSITFKLKILAAEIAVQLANLLTMPMVREGSYVYFGDDHLLVGEVCGGLRSLISLCALGAIAAYVSRTRNWARLLVLALSIPIAIISNVVRIFMLCVVGYFMGSETAVTPFFHDFTAAMIYVVGIILFLLVELLLSRFAAATPRESSA
jgi:exosortase